MSQGTQQERFEFIEVVRTLSICGVVWFHLEGAPHAEIGHAGLICFLLITVVFQAIGAGKYGWSEFLRRRVSRVGIQWVFWFAAYGVLNLLKGKDLFPYSSGVLAGLLTGTWIGLWFISYMLIMSLPVYGLARLTRSAPRAAVLVASSLVGAAMIVGASWLRGAAVLAVPWGQWIHALPSLAIGLAMAAALQLEGRSRLGALWGCTGLVVLTALGLAPRDPAIATTYGLGSLVVAVGFTVPGSVPKALVWLGGLSFGVYLVHPVVLTGLRLVPALWSHHALLFSCALVLSCLAVLVLRRMPVLRAVV